MTIIIIIIIILIAHLLLILLMKKNFSHPTKYMCNTHISSEKKTHTHTLTSYLSCSKSH
jgi:hypothetical protein